MGHRIPSDHRTVSGAGSRAGSAFAPPADGDGPGPALRSIVVRIAATAAAVALGAIAILFALTWSLTSAGLTRALAARVDTDVAGLADIHATSGVRELVARIADRRVLDDPGGNRAHYLLDDGTRRIAGDAARWPALDAARSAAGYVALDGIGPVYARAIRLGPRLRLLVAHEYRTERAIERNVATGFLAAGLLIALAVFALAWRQSRHLAGRIARINRAYRLGDDAAMMELVEDRRSDEIGELARRSGHALARQRRLLDAQRHVSDHVAHELRTPLLHLDNRLRGLLDEAPHVAETVALASSDIRRITSLLDSLLDIAENEANRGSARGTTPFDLSTLADDLAEVYRASMEEAGLHFSTRIAPGVEMCGEPTQISRLLANLLDNAAKYVPAGGAVRLEISDGPVILVADDGPGIDPALLPHVFERFRRGGTAGHHGHGLGLALALAIAQRHELALSVRSDPDGSRFRVAPEGER